MAMVYYLELIRTKYHERVSIKVTPNVYEKVHKDQIIIYNDKMWFVDRKIIQIEENSNERK